MDILGWDFAFELNEIARQDAEKAGIELRLVRIPREVLDKRAVEQGDVRFFELAALSVGVKQSGRRVTLSIEDFVIPLDDVPADVQKAVTHWSQWIDYWAVDWDNKDDTFHNEWQAYRTRKSQDLALHTDARVCRAGRVHRRRQGHRHSRQRHDEDALGEGGRSWHVRHGQPKVSS